MLKFFRRNTKCSERFLFGNIERQLEFTGKGFSCDVQCWSNITNRQINAEVGQILWFAGWIH